MDSHHIPVPTQIRCRNGRHWHEVQRPQKMVGITFPDRKKARVCVRPLLPGGGHVVVEKKRQMKEVEAAYTPKMNYISVCTIRTV